MSTSESVATKALFLLQAHRHRLTERQTDGQAAESHLRQLFRVPRLHGAGAPPGDRVRSWKMRWFHLRIKTVVDWWSRSNSSSNRIYRVGRTDAIRVNGDRHSVGRIHPALRNSAHSGDSQVKSLERLVSFYRSNWSFGRTVLPLSTHSPGHDPRQMIRRYQKMRF